MKGTRNNKKPSSGRLVMPGVDVEQLEKLLEFMATHGLEEFEYERGGFHIRLRKAAAGTNAASRPPAAAEGIAAAAAGAASSAPGLEGGGAAVRAREAPRIEEELHLIKSPIVGTFYASPSPDAEVFVKVGDVIQSGQVVCIVEAMKLMNEIEADVSGEVVRVLVENGQPVEYGQGLFSVRPAGKKK
jgi:acetyl-CoA carboxylase biotin carboxyl carrier protein